MELYRKTRLVDLKMSKKREKGASIAALIVVIAAFLAILSIGQIEVAKSSIEVSKQKQLLDNAGSILGNNIMKYGITYNCQNGVIQNETSASIDRIAMEMGIRPVPQIRCEDQGSFINERGQTRRRIKLSSTTGLSSRYSDGSQKTRDVYIDFNEQSQPVDKPDSSITFILDYSGSMNSFNRRQQLINAFNQFIAGQYDIKYGASLFSTDTLRPSVNINKGGGHDAAASRRISGQAAEGSTNFTAGLSEAKRLLIGQPIDRHFFVFITDGDPTAGSEPISWVRSNIFNTNPQNCRRLNPDENCITIYSLGVNISEGNVQRLIQMSGNASTPQNQREEYFYYARNDQIGRAFDAIIANILCKWGPIAPIPQNLQDLRNLNLFLNDMPVERNDWEIDENTFEVKLYNELCDHILENGGQITARYGKTKIEVIN